MKFFTARYVILLPAFTITVVVVCDFIQIGDFGMARDLMYDSYYTSATKGGKIPVKWTAPEVIMIKGY